MSFSMIKGDLEPDMALTATVNGTATDLTGATLIQLHWKKPDDTVVDVSLTTVNLSLGQVKRVWVAGDTDLVGFHRGRIVVTWPNTEEQTFPSDGSWFIWNVYKDS